MRQPILSRRDFIKLAGYGSLALTGLPRLEMSGTSAGLQGGSQPNLLVLVFDALSARDMSIYGFPRHTTPNMERFASQATVYHRHFAAGNFTTPGTASLLTGVHPWTHRAFHLQGQTTEAFARQNIFSLLPASYHKFAYTHNTLVQILLDQFKANIDDLLEISSLAEYSVILADKLPLDEFVVPFEAELLAQKNTNPMTSSLFLSLVDRAQRAKKSAEIDKEFIQDFPRGVPNCRAGEPGHSLCFTVETAIDWLINQFKERPQPFFGYVHLLPPHSPYNPRREFADLFDETSVAPKKEKHHFTEGKKQPALERLRRRYDQSIAYVDAEFGRLIDSLNSNNLLDNTCLIVTADHGEIFERGISGHNTPVLYEPLVHIPLLISYPGQRQRQDIQTPTHAIDVVPTLLQLSGENLPTHLEGTALASQPEHSQTQRDLFVSEIKSTPKNSPLRKGTFSLVHGQHKLIYYRRYEDFDEIFELYDLSKDPEEEHNLYSKQDQLSRDLKGILLDKLEPYLAA